MSPIVKHTLRLIPDLRNGLGGPTSFQKKLTGGLAQRQVGISFDSESKVHNAILLINATKKIGALLQAKRSATPIVQRLGSPFPSNSHLPIGLFQKMRTWIGMKNVAFIRRYLADRIVYQSRFVKKCWEGLHGTLEKPCQVIYNGVDLSHFSPDGPRYVSPAEICIISVEGTQCGSEDNHAFLLAKALTELKYRVELLMFGKPFENTAARLASHSFVKFMGTISNEDLPYYYRGATFYVLVDIVNSGCPNSVIEALACGTPVIGYDLAVLPEMLTPEAGRCVPADKDPWKGEHPGNVEGLIHAALTIIENNRSFRKAARVLAEECYGLDHMVDEYMEAIFRQPKTTYVSNIV